MTLHMQFSWRRLVFQAALIAFMFGAVMPFFARYDGQIAKADEATLSALYGNEVFMCTQNGFEWVKVADLAKKQHAPKSDDHFKCALCYVAASGAGHAQIPPMVLAVSSHHARALRLHFAVADAPEFQRAYLPTSPRAPPFIA